MRVPRFYAPGAAHHIISRLVDRRFFLEIEGARARYLSLLGRSLLRSDWRLIAYALMSNHIHLLAIAGQQEPEFWLKPVHSPFGFWLNAQVAGLGSVFAQRPTMIIVPDHNVGEVLAYIHNNPVSAGVVERAAASSWTSHRAYVGLAESPPWLHSAEGLDRCGFPNDGNRFDDWVCSQAGAPDPSLEAERLVERARPLAHRRGAEVATAVMGPDTHVALVARPSARIRPSPRVLISLVEQLTRLEGQIGARTKPALEARRIVLVVGTRLGVRGAELCAALGISKQRGSNMLREDRSIDSEVVEIVLRLLARGVDERYSVPVQVSGKIAGGKLRG